MLAKHTMHEQLDSEVSNDDTCYHISVILDVGL